MAGPAIAPGTTYSPLVGLMYIFNLIVGTGALTLPYVFQQAGWLLSTCIIVVLGFISYMTLTFVVESMAVANVLLKKEETPPSLPVDSPPVEPPPTRKKLRVRRLSGTHGYSLIPQEELSDAEVQVISNQVTSYASTNHLVDNTERSCDIKQTVEMGKMADMFFNKIGTNLFFLCIAIYLYGDLAIFGAAVGKSLRDVACTYVPSDHDCNSTISDSEICWEGSDISRVNAYRLFLSLFVITLGSFAFFNVQKTKLLQIFTTVIRWSAFTIMIVLACVRLGNSSITDKGQPSVANFSGVPNLFGSCVYSFMCHHSLPSLVTPISKKDRLYGLLVLDYVFVCMIYLLMALTGVFAFSQIDSLYTLSFFASCTDELGGGELFLKYFLALFPVFVLSTSFPVVSITLRNNLKQLLLTKEESTYSWYIPRILFPLLAIIPPTIIALATSNISFLVGITGSYAGAGVQYIVPALLAYYARRDLVSKTGMNPQANKYASPFRHVAWIYFVCIWAVVCIGIVTYNHIITGK